MEASASRSSLRGVPASVADSGPGDHGDSIFRAAFRLDEEERELWKQLRRKRDFEGRVAEKRAQLAELRDKRRGLSAACAEAAASVELLSGEVAFAKRQERELEHDIAVFKESNRILRSTFDPSQLPPPQPSDQKVQVKDLVAEERARRESVQLQHDQIAHLRGHLERLQAEKISLQERQQALFDRQRSAEQDRNRLLGSLQDDRSGINDLRAERIRLWEERASMEREIAQILKEAHLNGFQGDSFATGARARSPGNRSEASTGFQMAHPVAGVSGGVRGHVSRDTPHAFVEARPQWGDSGPSLEAQEPARPHWTRFESPEVRPPSFGGHNDMGGRSASAEGSPSSRRDGNAGITEWSGRLRDFRAHVASSHGDLPP